MKTITTPTAIEPCPEDELLAAYVDGKPRRHVRRGIERHIATCERCYRVVSEVARFVLDQPDALPAAHALPGHESQDERIPPICSPGAAAARGFRDAPWAREPLPRRAALWTLSAAVPALVVTLLVVSDWRPLFVRGGIDQSTRATLVAAVGSQRTFEPRLTGGFGYGPIVGRLRAAGRSTSVSPNIRLAAAEIEKQTAGDRSSDAQALLGAAHLLAGEVDAAVVSLERAAQLSPDNAALASDLAAAYLVRRLTTGEWEDGLRAQRFAERALAAPEGGRQLPEAQFNLALALEQVGRRADALRAWEEYLAVDSSSEWAGEARRNIERLRARPVQ